MNFQQLGRQLFTEVGKISRWSQNLRSLGGPVPGDPDGTRLCDTDQAESVVGGQRKPLGRLLAVRGRRGGGRHAAGGYARRAGRVHALHGAGHGGRELRVGGRRVHELVRRVASRAGRVGVGRSAGGVVVVVRRAVHRTHHAVARRRTRQRLGQLLLLLPVLGAPVLKPNLTTTTTIHSDLATGRIAAGHPPP